MAEDAHISTIATHPDWRGRGLGELLLVSLLECGEAQGAWQATLEVRASNAIAQALYGKYLFKKVGVRKRYYSDNGEDAIIMTTPRFPSPLFQENLAYRKTLLQTRLGKPTLRQPEQGQI